MKRSLNRNEILIRSGILIIIFVLLGWILYFSFNYFFPIESSSQINTRFQENSSKKLVGIGTEQYPRLSVDCDGLLRNFKNKTKELNDITGMLSIYTVMCMDMLHQDLGLYNSTWYEYDVRFVLDGICYGRC